MVTFKAHFDGKAIVLDEPVSLTRGQSLRIVVEEAEAVPASEKRPDRVPGRQADDRVVISPDFDEELGDAFWGLAEKP